MSHCVLILTCYINHSYNDFGAGTSGSVCLVDRWSVQPGKPTGRRSIHPAKVSLRGRRLPAVVCSGQSTRQGEVRARIRDRCSGRKKTSMQRLIAKKHPERNAAEGTGKIASASSHNHDCIAKTERDGSQRRGVKRCPYCTALLKKPIPEDRLPPFCDKCIVEYLEASPRKKAWMIGAKLPLGQGGPMFLPFDPNRYPELAEGFEPGRPFDQD